MMKSSISFSYSLIVFYLTTKSCLGCRRLLLNLSTFVLVADSYDVRGVRIIHTRRVLDYRVRQVWLVKILTILGLKLVEFGLARLELNLEWVSQKLDFDLGW